MDNIGTFLSSDVGYRASIQMTVPGYVAAPFLEMGSVGILGVEWSGKEMEGSANPLQAFLAVMPPFSRSFFTEEVAEAQHLFEAMHGAKTYSLL